MNAYRSPILTVVYFFFLLAISFPSFCKVIHVSQNAQGDQSGDSWENAISSISSGLEISSPGDEIWVESGIYKEHVSLRYDVALYGGYNGTESSRDVRNWETNPTVIDGENQHSSVVTCAKNAILDGFTVKRGKEHAMYCASDSVRIQNCILTESGYYPDNGINVPEGAGLFCRDADIILKNCKFREIVGGSGAAIFLSQSTASIDSCEFKSNEVHSWGLLYLYKSDVTISKSVFSDSVTNFENHAGGLGIYCGESTLHMMDCRFLHNELTNTCVLHFYNSSGIVSNTLIANNTGINPNYTSNTYSTVYCENSSPELINCTIAGNQGSGVGCNEKSYPKIENCILWNQGVEILIDQTSGIEIKNSCIQGGWPGEGNVERYPEFTNPFHGDFHLQNGSICIDGGNSAHAPAFDIDGRIRWEGDEFVDIGAYETPPNQVPATHTPSQQRFYVRSNAQADGDGSSWEGALNSIGKALFFTDSNAEIWVSKGIYHEVVQLEKDSRLIGGFAGTETSMEERDWKSNQTVIHAMGIYNPVIIGADHASVDGVTIKGATQASGVLCWNTSPDFRNCVISDNYKSYRGGGVNCTNSEATFSNCIIRDNKTCGSNGNGAGMYIQNSSILLSDCVFENNEGHPGIPPWNGSIAGGVEIGYSTATFERCVFSGNKADYGIINIENFSNVLMKGCSITENESRVRNTIGASSSSKLQCINCLIANNKAGENASVTLERIQAEFINCTIADNSSPGPNGIYHQNGTSSITVKNCILRNPGDEIINQENGNFFVSYSCLEGNRPGEGNITVNPLFVNSQNGDYRLAHDSPCIDAGDPSKFYNDAIRPPGLGKERCDLGIYGGPGNGDWFRKDSETGILNFMLF